MHIKRPKDRGIIPKQSSDWSAHTLRCRKWNRNKCLRQSYVQYSRAFPQWQCYSWINSSFSQKQSQHLSPNVLHNSKSKMDNNNYWLMCSHVGLWNVLIGWPQTMSTTQRILYNLRKVVKLFWITAIKNLQGQHLPTKEHSPSSVWQLTTVRSMWNVLTVTEHALKGWLTWGMLTDQTLHTISQAVCVTEIGQAVFSDLIQMKWGSVFVKDQIWG